MNLLFQITYSRALYSSSEVGGYQQVRVLRSWSAGMCKKLIKMNDPVPMMTQRGARIQGERVQTRQMDICEK